MKDNNEDYTIPHRRMCMCLFLCLFVCVYGCSFTHAGVSCCVLDHKFYLVLFTDTSLYVSFNIRKRKT